MRKIPKAILITGMPGSGKTTVAEYMGRRGFSIVNMGDVLREMASDKGLELTPQNLGLLAEEIRIKEGRDAVARRCIDKIRGHHLKAIVIDGIRSPEEVEAFREAFEVILIAIHASPKTRFKRISRRGRGDDVMNWKMFLERDRRELSFGLGSVIAMADHMLINEGTLEDLERSIKNLLSEINSYKIKEDP